jgi:uncharacterized protein (TIGR03083 family)
MLRRMRTELCGTQPILCAPILREVDEHLIDLLRSLSATEWELPTVAPQWRVRDVAAHLLDTALRKLSLARDRYRVENVDIHSYQDIVDLVNRLNREGVTVYRRLSPPVLIDLMQTTSHQFADYHEALDPFAPAAFGVSWAGEMTSPVWFDTARELTERWHHQQQVRLATNRPGIMIPSLYHPVIDTFLRGMPHAFRDAAAPKNGSVLIEISGDCGGQWCLVHSPPGWRFAEVTPPEVSARIVIPQDLAWRVFTKGVDRALLAPFVTMEGDSALAERVLKLVAIVG